MRAILFLLLVFFVVDHIRCDKNFGNPPSNSRSQAGRNHFTVNSSQNRGAQPNQQRATSSQNQQSNQQQQHQNNNQQQQHQNNNQQQQNKNKQQNNNQQNKEDAEGGRLLSLPVPELCATRPKQWQFNGHAYFLSSDIDGLREEVDWLKARNLCRQYCMDTISIETLNENDMVLELFKNRNELRYIWTSGRICDFAGCSARSDLQPIHVNGWFWSGTNRKIEPTDKQPTGWPYDPWSATGHKKVPQPDNAEFEINGTFESCLAILDNLYKDNTTWHDIACYHKKPFLCEDSDLLLTYAHGKEPQLGILA